MTNNNIYIQSSLAEFVVPREALGIDGSCGVEMQEITEKVQFNLRCDMSMLARSSNHAEPFFGSIAELSSNRFSVHADYECYWLGPDERLLVARRDKSNLITQACSRLHLLHHALTDLSDAQTIIQLSGEEAQTILMHGSMFDFHQQSFTTEMCAQTLLAGVPTLISCHTDTKLGLLFYRLYIRRSYADYLSLWLIDAASEVGFRIVLNES
ncbi:MAG: hypothetical protein CL398_10845 [Acidiferrobacteraceae bacterium]|nr:hypothetical protein [Acidiferrobacteraceae bacterium]|tara:strand:- start:1031 stop:1663 length:633 start_codon:yes stop_codon:yes gene_type:complete